MSEKLTMCQLCLVYITKNKTIKERKQTKNYKTICYFFYNNHALISFILELLMLDCVSSVQVYLAELRRIQQQNYQEHQRMQEKLQTDPQYTVCDRCISFRLEN